MLWNDFSSHYNKLVYNMHQMFGENEGAASMLMKQNGYVQY